MRYQVLKPYHALLVFNRIAAIAKQTFYGVTLEHTKRRFGFVEIVKT
jgi:hypothetical protein